MKGSGLSIPCSGECKPLKLKHLKGVFAKNERGIGLRLKIFDCDCHLSVARRL